MKIGMVAHRAWPSVGGAEVLLRHISTELSTTNDVTIIARRIDNAPTGGADLTYGHVPEFGPIRDGNVTVNQLRFNGQTRRKLGSFRVFDAPVVRRYTHRPSRRRILSAYARIVGPSLAQQLSGCEVVHAWSGDLLGAAAERAARILDVPFVISPQAHAGQYGDSSSCGWLYRQADVVTGGLQTELDIYRGLGVPEQHLALCGQGVPPLPQADATDVRSRYGIEGPIVLFIGAKRAYKGADLLAAAAELLHASHPETKVVFVGPGVLTAEHRNSDSVIDVGVVDDTERAAWLRAANVLAIPSEYESFSLVVLEAWSVGIPAVVSDIPTFQELARLSSGALIAPRDASALADSLGLLLDSPEQMVALGRAGHDFWASGHTAELAARRFKEVYDQTLILRTR